MTQLTQYAMGFVVSPDGSQVALLRKERPAHLVGLWMGPAGHVEDGETPLQAIRREFLEEAGVDVPDWTFVKVLEKPERPCDLHLFFARHDLSGVRTMTDEEVRVFEIDAIHDLPAANALTEIRDQLMAWARGGEG